MKRTQSAMLEKQKKVLKLLRMINLTVERKTTIFKTYAISKVIHLSLVTNLSTEFLNEQKIMQKKKKNAKIIYLKWQNATM